MKSLRCVGAALVVVILSWRGAPAAACEPAEGAAPQGETRATKDLSEMLGRACERFGQPGMGAVVVRGGGVEASGVAGVRVRGEAARIEPGDAFHIGSNTKAMTAYLLASLARQGKLKLDAPLPEVLPEMAAEMHEKYRSVTVRQVLGHRAGLPPMTSGAAPDRKYKEGLEGSPREQRREMARRILADAPASEPGGGMVYSNAGYSVAAAIAERAADEPWESLMESRIFRPLGMTSAGFGWPATKAHADRPRGHSSAFGPPRPQPLGDRYELGPAMAPAGDVHASIGDYGLWLRENLAALRGGPTTLDGEALRMLHCLSAEAGGAPKGYALGWGVSPSPRGPMSAHDGSAGTFYLTAGVLPEADVAIAVVSNAGGGDEACHEVAKRLLDRFAPRPKPAPAPEKPE
ncbi:MAG: beta-lactamase family protein [Phycisphaerales bacterium]|nr:beta-lactamase family protein [Phycisphaerales bacterium]